MQDDRVVLVAPVQVRLLGAVARPRRRALDGEHLDHLKQMRLAHFGLPEQQERDADVERVLVGVPRREQAELEHVVCDADLEVHLVVVHAANHHVAENAQALVHGDALRLASAHAPPGAPGAQVPLLLRLAPLNDDAQRAPKVRDRGVPHGGDVLHLAHTERLHLFVPLFAVLRAVDLGELVLGRIRQTVQNRVTVGVVVLRGLVVRLAVVRVPRGARVHEALRHGVERLLLHPVHVRKGHRRDGVSRQRRQREDNLGAGEADAHRQPHGTVVVLRTLVRRSVQLRFARGVLGHELREARRVLQGENLERVRVVVVVLDRSVVLRRLQRRRVLG